MKSASRTRLIVTAVSILSIHTGSGNAQNAHPPDWGEWRVYGGAPDNIRYSSLKQINRQNVSRLKIAWAFDSGDAYPGSEMQCNPIVIDGILYATTPKINVIALDAATGRLIWRFDPNKGRKVMDKMRNRGVTYWSDGTDKRIFVTVRQFLYSLDARTGQPNEAFGNSGHIDVRDDLGREPKNWITMTSPSVVYNDLVIIGSTLSETVPSSPGDIRAYDARTGKLRWSFHTIPHKGEFAYETWPQDSWTYSGGANSWAGMSLDTKRGLVFVPTAPGLPDFYGANRVGDNLFANSVIALNAETGERVWHFQTVRHDLLDRDLPAPPSLVVVQRNGHRIDGVAQITKTGHVFLFDRETGEPLFPIEYRPVPPSDLEGEVAAETQPFPSEPAPFARQWLTRDMLTMRTPQAHKEALEHFVKLRSAGPFAPGSREGTLVFPGLDGGGEWGGAAFDPETGLLYVNSSEMAWILRMVEHTSNPGGQTSGKAIYLKECTSCHGPDRKGSPPQVPSLLDLSNRYSESETWALISQGTGRMPGFARLEDDGVGAVVDYIYNDRDATVSGKPSSSTDPRFTNDGYNKFLDRDGYPAIQPPWGTLNAINLNTGKIVWKVPLGEYPELAAKGIPTTGTENYGGPVVTAGGLLFIAATCYDKKFRVFDKATGKLLWKTTLPAAGNATPAIYEVNGRQFVVIAAGGGKDLKSPSGGTYVAFALPR